MGPCGSSETYILNYATPEINVIVMAKALFDCWSQLTMSTLRHNQGCVTIDSVIPAIDEFQ